MGPEGPQGEAGPQGPSGATRRISYGSVASYPVSGSASPMTFEIANQTNVGAQQGVLAYPGYAEVSPPSLGWVCKSSLELLMSFSIDTGASGFDDLYVDVFLADPSSPLEPGGRLIAQRSLGATPDGPVDVVVDVTAVVAAGPSFGLVAEIRSFGSINGAVQSRASSESNRNLPLALRIVVYDASNTWPGGTIKDLVVEGIWYADHGVAEEG